MYKRFIMFSVVFFIAASNMAFGEEPKGRRSPRAALDMIDIEARVEAIDFEKREVVLRGPMGNLTTIKAGEEAKRFNEIEAGDIVKARFWTYLQAEFREPTEDEIAIPLVILAEAGKTIKDLPPGAVVGALVKAVVSIEIINRPDMMVTVKGPRGNYATIPVADAKILEELRIGEIVILTYAESVALLLEKKE